MAVCLRCGHTWSPRTLRPARCPECLTKYWDTPKGTKGKAQEETEPRKGGIVFYCGCGSPLARIPWNSTTDVLHCDNHKCGSFHIPVSHLPRPYGAFNRQSPENCNCGSPLLSIEWNPSAEIQFCDNRECRFFHRPIFVKKERGIEKSLTRRWEYDSKEEDDTSEVLQRMRNRILAQRQTPKVS